MTQTYATKGHTMNNLSARTPVQIDTRLAELHGEIGQTSAVIKSLTDRVLDRAGLRVRHAATWTTRKVTYTVTGSFEDACSILAIYAAEYATWVKAGHPSDSRPSAPATGYYDTWDDAKLGAIASERATAVAARYVMWTEANELNGEYLRRPWPRYFLVVSSAGHIHSSTGCSTCRRTTAFGWMPERSGQSEAEAIESLGTHADALCSVCYPSAPVVSKRTNVTKAKAEKMATATYVADIDN